MAILEDGLMNNFIGRYGNAVVYKLNGKTVMRTLSSVKPGKAQGIQKQYRQDFGRVMKYMQAVKTFISKGFYHVAEGRSAFHTALSVNLMRYREAGMPVTPEWLLLSDGTLAGTTELSLEKQEDGTVILHWGEPETGKINAGDDVAEVIALNNRTLRSKRETLPVKRSDGQIIMQMPEVQTGDEVHFFITFRNLYHPSYKKNKSEISTSQWAGKVVI